MNTLFRNASLIFAISFLAISTSAVAQSRRLGLGVNKNSPAEPQRVALVIGNSAYANAPLKNSVNDARDIAQALRELGFEVIYRENINQNEMKRDIRTFGERTRAGGTRLFYYAGHGVQVNGENFLIPIGADFDNEREVEYEAINVGLVLAQMEEVKNSINIVVLDACRNNPFARSFRSASRGLASIDAPTGTLIAYATAPGSVASDGIASNGIYTQELLRYMRTSGMSVEEIFKRTRISVREKTQGKQTPWESSSLTGDFYFRGANHAGATEKQESTRLVTDTSALELSFWDSIKNSSDPDDFSEYLRKYPNGTFAGIASNRLKKLRVSAAKPVEQQTELSSMEGTVWQATSYGAMDSLTFTLKLNSGGKLLWLQRGKNFTDENKDIKGTWKQEGDFVYIDIPATPFNKRVTGVLGTVGDSIKGQLKIFENASNWNDVTFDFYRAP